MTDAVNPQHYKNHPSGVQAIEVCQHLDFSLGNAIKYVWRAGQKGDAREDLKKAAWYLECALKLNSRGLGLRRSPLIVPSLTRVIDSEPEGSLLRDVLRFIAVPALEGDAPRIADALKLVGHAIGEAPHA